MKRTFTFGVVLTTILWSVGAAALVPGAAYAVDMGDETSCDSIVAGNLVKTHGNPDIWAVNEGLTRSYFANGDLFHSWNNDGSYSNHYLYVTSACMNSFEAVGALTPRPGTYLLKEGATDYLWAVLPGNKLTKISAEAAAALYGTDYATKRLMVMDNASWVLYKDYRTTDEITELVPHEGMLAKSGDDYYYVGAGMTLRKVLASGMTANRLNSGMAYMLASLDGYTMGDDVELEETALSDVTQGLVVVVTPGDDDETPVATGAVTASLSASTPAGTNLPDGTSFNNLLKVNLKAGSEAASVTGVTLKKGGYLLVTDVTGVDVVDGNDVRHGNVASSFNSDNEVNILFGSNPINIPANGTVTLSFRVNLSASATASTLELSLTGLDTTGSVAGLPIKGNSFNVVDGSNAVAGATIAVQAISGSSGTNLNADDENEQEITKFRISETASKEDLMVYKLTLFNYGNADDTDYKDVQLVAVDGSVLATVQPEGQNVVFDLSANPYKILKGTYKDFTVRMKIVGGTSKTIHLVAYNDYDLEVKGKDTGAYVLATGSTNDGGSANFPEGAEGTYNKVTVSAGTLTFNKHVDSPSNAVTPGATNVVLAKYYAKPVGENMELRKVSFGIIQTASSLLTGNVYVRVNGTNVYSVAASSLAAAGTVASATLTSYPILVAGENAYITVEGSVLSTATSGVSYTVNDFGLTEVKKLTSNTITTTGLGGTVDGNAIAVNAAAYNVTTLSTPVAQSIVNGNNDFTFAQFELNAGASGEDIRIASFVVSNNGTGTVTDISNLEIWDGDEQLTTSNSTATGAASTTFTFSNPLVIPQGTVKTLTLKADVTGAGAGYHKFVLYSLSSTGRVTGTSVTASPIAGSGQAMTIASAATVTLSLVSGATGSPVSTQVMNVGTKDGTYFAFRITPQNEAIKVRTLKLTAASSGTSLDSNDVKNLRLYRNDETTPFLTSAEMACSGGTCTATWTASDNLLPSAVEPGAPVTIYVKADIGDAGIARLGHDFIFSIAATSTDFVGVGKSATAFTVSGSGPTVAGRTHIVPFNVQVVGVSPLTAATVGVSSGATVGIFKVNNLGSRQITLGTSTFNNSGSATSTMDWVLKGSVDAGAQTDASVSLGAAATSTQTTWGNITDATINGGSWRYLTIKTDATAVNYDTHQWTVNALGQLLYSVTEAQLGYDENADGDLSDTINNLYVTGTPSLEVVTSRNS